MTFKFGHDITILKMAILDKFDNIEIEPTLCDLGTATASDLQTLINTWATVHFHPNISSHHAINNTLEYMEWDDSVKKNKDSKLYYQAFPCI